MRFDKHFSKVDPSCSAFLVRGSTFKKCLSKRMFCILWTFYCLLLLLTHVLKGRGRKKYDSYSKSYRRSIHRWPILHRPTLCILWQARLHSMPKVSRKFPLRKVSGPTGNQTRQHGLSWIPVCLPLRLYGFFSIFMEIKKKYQISTSSASTHLMRCPRSETRLPWF